MSGLSVPSFSLHCGQGNNPLKTIALYRVHACEHVRFVSPSPTTMKVALLENKGKGQVSQFALKVLHSSQNINGNTDCSYLQLPCPLVSISVHSDGFKANHKLSLITTQIKGYVILAEQARGALLPRVHKHGFWLIISSSRMSVLFASR